MKKCFKKAYIFIGEIMENQPKFEFMTEKVKERPLNRRKLLQKTFTTIFMAVIFGLIACITFSVLEPVISNWLHPQEEIEKIEIPIVTQETLPEDMMVHEETTLEPTQEVIDTLKNEIELTAKDYQKLYQNIHALVLGMQSATVTVTGMTQEIDLFNDAYETTGQSIGYIFAQNTSELMIMVEKDAVWGSENIEVTFVDGSKVAAQIRGTDANTGLAVLAVEKKLMAQNTREVISCVSLGSSNLSTLVASPVIAMGNPLGNNSVVYGMITSMDTTIKMPDCTYKLLTTDIYGSKDATGILVDFSGKVIGLIHQNYNKEEALNLISALGITEIKQALQRMSNGIENSYLGIQGTDVPAKVANSKEIPMGVYVTGIDMGSPAMQAGIQSGDIIVSMGKHKITSFADYVKILSEWHPGENKDIILMRQKQGKYKTANVEIVVGNRE